MNEAEFRRSVNAEIRRMVARATPCTCAAYPFPHRPKGGECYAGTFNDPDCTCTAPAAGCRDIDPPEVRACSWCPIHGDDWRGDDQRDAAIDDRLTGDRI